MKAASVTLVIGLSLLIAAKPASGEVRSGTFKSAALGREVAYVVDLPPSYDSAASRKYPVVYALHGLFEGPGFWEGRGLATILAQLRAAGSLPEFLVVAVDGGNSFFVNAPGGRYEDMVTQDLVAHVEASYRVVPGRAGRALLGISMGGYGALHIAFDQPGLVAAVATHSAMLLEAVPSAEQGARRGQMAAFHQVFGDPIDVKLWSDNDPLALARQLDRKAAPALFLDCGAEDRYGLPNGHRELHRILEERGVAHTLELPPGDHGYEFVRARLERSLRFLGESLAGAPALPNRPVGAVMLVWPTPEPLRSTSWRASSPCGAATRPASASSSTPGRIASTASRCGSRGTPPPRKTSCRRPS